MMRYGGIIIPEECSIVKIFTESEYLKQKPIVAETDYQLFFQHSFDHFLILDQQGIILKVNDQWLKTLGYAPSEMEGGLFLSFVHPDDLKPTIDKFAEIVGDNSEEGFVNRYRANSGEYRFMEWKAGLFGNRVYASARDITLRKMLKAEKEHFNRFFTASKDLFVIIDQSGVMLRVNPVVTEILGYTPEEFLSLSYQSLAAPDYLAGQAAAINKLKRTGEVLNHRSRILRKDGSIAEIIWHLIYTEEHQTIYAAGRDMTEMLNTKRKIEESEHRFRSLFENMNSGFVLREMIYDKQGRAVDFRFLEVNEAHTVLTGYQPDELIGKTILEFNPDYDAALIQIYANVANTGIPAHTEIYYPPLDKYFGVQSYRPKQGQVASVFQDITEQVKASKIIGEKNTELEKANAEKDKFLSIIAHDLRSPFQGFLGVLEMLNDESEFLTTEEIKVRLQRIRDSGKRLYALIDNLLLWSSFHRGKVPFLPVKVNPASCIAVAIESFSSAFTVKELSVITDTRDDIYIIADKMMMNTVLRNLLSNAVKFSYRGGKITISVKKQADMAEISVQDEGVGIPAADLSRLFKKDEKVSTPGTEKEASSGLGLLLCSEFTEANGGTISVESIQGKGSSFILRFPLSQV